MKIKNLSIDSSNLSYIRVPNEFKYPVLKYNLVVYIFVIICCFCNSQFVSQEKLDVDYYLLSDLDYESLAPDDQHLLDSALTIYHSGQHDTVRLYALAILADNLYDGQLWPRYNKLLYDQSIEAEKVHFLPAEKERILILQSTALNNFGYVEFNKGNLDKSLEFYEQSIKKQKEIGYDLGYSHSLNNLGALYFSIGKLDSALNKYNECLVIQKKLDDIEALVQTYNNIAVIYREIGETKESAENHLKALAYCQQLENKTEIASTYAYLGELYLRDYNLGLSKTYFEKGLELQLENGFTEGIGFAYSNLGKLYSEFDSLKRAKSYFSLADSTFSKIQHWRGLAGVKVNLGIIARKQDNYDLARKYYLESLSIRKDMSDAMGTASCYSLLANIHHLEKNEDSTMYYAAKSIQIAREINDYKLLKQNHHILYKIYKNRNNPAISLFHHEQFLNAKDSLEKVENKEALYDLQYKHIYLSQAYEDSLVNIKKEIIAQKKIDAQNQEIEEHKVRNWYFTLVGIFMISIILILIIGYRNKIKRNKEIARQKRIVEHKNFEITESINYAQRIQNALLDNLDTLKEAFPQSFVLYLPKDIVSGDFYWWKKQGDDMYIAVADCTGHGVPGALMSSLGISNLNEILANKVDINPAEILNELRAKIITELSQSGSSSSSKDGMDISLIKINQLTGQLKWSGANNSLYVFSDQKIEIPENRVKSIPTNDNSIGLEVLPDHQGVGFAHQLNPFTEISFQLPKNGQIFLSTDGYIDQFGGEKGGKLKSKNFKNLLAEVSSLKTEVQEEKLLSFFENWKADYEQLDDVCILGLKTH